jgi:transposase
MHRYGLHDDEWERIEHLPPGREGMLARPPRIIGCSSRRSSTAIGQAFRGGICLSGSGIGRRCTHVIVVGRERRLGRVFKVLAAEYHCASSPAQRRGTQKKHQGDEAIGRGRGGLSTKIHAWVNALGNPLAFLLTPGQAHDLEGADAFLPQMQADTLLADRAFDADKRAIEPLVRAGKIPVIPSVPGRKEPRPYDRDLFRGRHLIENFFCKLKQFRAIATRYDKLAANFLAGFYAAAIVIWLN